MTNIMPTHVKISIEPGIRELFLKQELLDFETDNVRCRRHKRKTDKKKHNTENCGFLHMT
jgi:hypothetical protein